MDVKTRRFAHTVHRLPKLSSRLCKTAFAGLDPAIHLLRENLLRRLMDARVKPAHDDLRERRASYGYNAKILLDYITDL